MASSLTLWRSRLGPLDIEMNRVLLRLEMTSEGATASRDADSGGGSVRHYEDVVLATDHGHGGETAVDLYRRLWRHAEVDDERQALIAAARAKLAGILHSRAEHDPAEEESLEEFYDRIVNDGEGWTQREVANALNTSATIVARARRARGRELDRGYYVEDARGWPTAARRERVRELAAADQGPRQIAHALTLPPATVARDIAAGS